MSFDILSAPQLPKVALIEASAGTGKTFAIEHAFQRLLLEEDYYLEDILVVTFTKAAVIELRNRISFLLNQTIKNKNWPYLEKLDPKKVESKLKETIELFSEAQVWTIHSFCLRMLQECVLQTQTSLHLKETSVQDTLLTIINDVWQLPQNLLHPIEIKVLFQHYKQDLNHLARELIFLILPGHTIDSKHLVCKAELEKLLNELPEFDFLFSYLKGVRDRNGKIKKEFENDYLSFLRIKDGKERIENLFSLRSFFEHFKDSHLKAKISDDIKLKSQKVFHVTKKIVNLIHPNQLLLALAELVQRHWKTYSQYNDILSPDDMIRTVHQAVDNDDVKKYIQNRFKAVLIDEFQDTDKWQWSLFEQVFVHSPEKPYLFFLGDPKQAIYAFRSADVYTYVKAAESLSKEALYHLNCCYRADPQLMHALNTLFSSKGFFSLPRTGLYLEYHEINSPVGKLNKQFKDEKGAIHFPLFYDTIGRAKRWPKQSFTEEKIFPYISNEVKHLLLSNEFNPSEVAVLVKDRFQGNALKEYLHKEGIPAYFARFKSLSESPVVAALRELLFAFAYPNELSYISLAMAGRLVAWSWKKIEELKHGFYVEQVLSYCQRLHKVWLEQGIAVMMEEAFQIVWSEESLEQGILKREGREFFHELSFLIQVCQNKELDEGISFERLFVFLDEIIEGKLTQDGFLIPPLLEENSLTLMTMHLSKGLEFPCVFALGALSRTPSMKELINTGNEWKLFQKEEAIFSSYCDDLDSEKLRQLYVTLTRAQNRVYIPLLFDKGKSSISQGTASPLELAIDIWTNASTIEEVLSNWSKDCSITYESVELSETTIFQQENSSALVEPADFKFQYVEQRLSSFSSMKMKHYRVRKERETVPLFPIGTEVGLIMHKIFECLSFETLKNPTSEDIMYYTQGTVLESYEDVLVAKINQIFSQPLGKNFALKDLSGEKFIREIPFLSKEAPCLLKGVIDAFFEYKGHYYLLDWKTNFLGEQEESYCPEALKVVMEEEEYMLQKDIYKKALKAYLSLVETRPFQVCFGGVFYLFIRGMNGQEGLRGVYYSC